MADDKTKYILKEDFLRALSALMSADPVWGIVTAIQLVAQAQDINRDQMTPDEILKAS